MVKKKEEEAIDAGKDNVTMLLETCKKSVNEEGNMASKKHHKLHKGDVGQLREDRNSKAHLPVYCERKSVLVENLRKKLFTLKLKLKGQT